MSRRCGGVHVVFCVRWRQIVGFKAQLERSRKDKSTVTHTRGMLSDASLWMSWSPADRKAQRDKTFPLTCTIESSTDLTCMFLECGGGEPEYKTKHKYVTYTSPPPSGNKWPGPSLFQKTAMWPLNPKYCPPPMLEPCNLNSSFLLFFVYVTQFCFAASLFFGVILQSAARWWHIYVWWKWKQKSEKGKYFKLSLDFIRPDWISSPVILLFIPTENCRFII